MNVQTRMLSDTSLLTLETLWREALPPNTQLLTGDLDRPVQWVVTVTPGAALPHVEGGELVLLTPGEHGLQVVFGECKRAGVAGVACLPPISPVALAMAEAAGLTVLQLPPGSRIREVERAVLGVLLDRRGNVEQLSAQINRQLVQLASENVGLEGLVHGIARSVNKGVIVQDKHLRIKQFAASPALSDIWDALSDLLKDKRSLPDSLSDRHRLPLHTLPGTIQHIQVGERTVVRMIAPIVTKDTGRGYLSFLAPDESDFGELDRLVISNSAMVCALEMARAKVISELEKKMRGDFLTGLMTGNVSEAEAQSEIDRFGHDSSTPHVVLVMLWYGPKRPSNRRLETLINGILGGSPASGSLVQLFKDELRLFFAADSADPIQAAREFAEDVQRQVRVEFRDAARLAIGIGPVARRVYDWRVSYREAVNAADIARRLQSDMPLYAGDLGIYSLLARPDFRADLLALRDRMIGSLLQYEEGQRADLLLTLEAFFKCHGNATQTAEILSVHRNTLFYRMNRIAEITGLDLNQPDVRLAVHLSLKIHRLLSSEG